MRKSEGDGTPPDSCCIYGLCVFEITMDDVHVLL